MFCRKCGAEITNGAGFCPKCGTEVVAPPQGVGAVATAPVAKTTNGSNVRKGKVKNTGGSGVQIAEGLLSVILAVLAAFAPVTKINYFFGTATLSIADLVYNISRLSDYIDGYAAVAPLLGFFTLLVCVGSLINAKQAFSNQLPRVVEFGPTAKLKVSHAGDITMFALALIVLLNFAAHDTYGIAGATGWVWVLLIGGIVCEVLHHIRCSE